MKAMSEAYNLYQLGRARLRDGAAAQATVPLERARRLEPDKASIREALGIAYFRITNWDAAEREFRKVLDLSPVDEYAHYALGRALANQGRHSEAAVHLKLSRCLRPRDGGGIALDEHLSALRAVAAPHGLPVGRVSVEIGDEGRVTPVSTCRLPRELDRILACSAVVERLRERLTDVEQPVREGVDDELVVTVGLLRRLRWGRVPCRLGRGGLGQEFRIVNREQVELPHHEIVEPSLPPKPHMSSP